MADSDDDELIEGLLAGDQRALARTISVIENREPAYRELVAALYRHPGDAEVVGVTGSPGVGKSTLVDALAGAYRDRGETVGVVAIDPSSPFSGGALLGDRVRMGRTAGDMDVFVRSMSARGNPGGLAAATMDAVRALSAFGKDVVIVETVGAGQNEVDVVTTADTVLVVTQPTSGDDVQALKAGILEIGDVYVVNKADLDGADRTVRELRTMIEEAGALGSHRAGFEGASAVGDDADWTPPVVETEATHGEGVSALVETIDGHRDFLAETGLDERKVRVRVEGEIRNHIAAAVEERVDGAVRAAGGMGSLVDAVLSGEADPYGLTEDLVSDGALGERDATPTVGDDN